MNDIFYKLKRHSVKTIKDILLWAKNNSVRVDVDMIDSDRIDVRRISADKSFEEVWSLIDKKSSGYFRIILRKNQNLYGILYNEAIHDDLLEIGIRGIDVGRKEYFLIIRVKKEMLEELKKKCKIAPLH